MDSSEEEVDELNELTFGSVEAGDWESEHERFVLEHGGFEHSAPEADALPRFWEAPNDFSLLWSQETFGPHTGLPEDETSERGVDLEETLQKLVSDDDAFEDPAILDISRKVSNQKLYGSALEKILDAPAYPLAPVNILQGSRDIWGLVNSQSPVYSNGDSNTSLHGINLKGLLGQMTQSSANSHTCQTHSGVPVSLNRLLLTQQNGLQSHSRSIKSEHGASSKPTSYLSASTTGRSMPWASNSAATPSFTDFYAMCSSVGTPTVPSPSHFTQSQILKLMSLRAPGVISTPCNTAFAPAMHPRVVSTNDARTSALQMLWMNAQKVGWNHCRGPPGVPDMNARRISSNRCMPAPLHVPSTPVSFPGMPPGSVAASDTVQHLPFHGSLSSPLSHRFLTSRSVLPRSTSTLSDVTQMAVNDTEHTISLSADSQELFDPNVGSWMTHFESVGVLLMHLRPLMVSNPYVQDYYFAVRWLRQMSAYRAKQLASGTAHTSSPSPVMHMPSPVTIQNLIDPEYYHQTALGHKLVLPLVLVHLSTGPALPNHSGTPSHAGAQQATLSEDLPSSATISSIHAQATSSSDAGQTLGRVTRSNVYRPRLVAELSIASALANDTNESFSVSSSPHPHPSETDAKVISAVTVDVVRHPSPFARSARLRRLLLARIERMYTLILHVDEVDVSLSRVVVHNDVRLRLMRHRQELVEHLSNELSRSSKDPSLGGQTVVPHRPDQTLFFSELLTVRKGVRLFSTVLYYLSPILLQKCLTDFVLRFSELHVLCLLFDTEYTSVLYPGLRHAVYQLGDIGVFMKNCFPEVSDSLPFLKLKRNVQAMVTSQLGLSLIFCLLDACARVSKPDDPSNFVRYAAYFCYVTTTTTSAGDSQVLPLESFPHLASIIPLYVKPERHYTLTSAQLERFCNLIQRSTIVPRQSELGKPVHIDIVVTSDSGLCPLSSSVTCSISNEDPNAGSTPVLAS